MSEYTIVDRLNDAESNFRHEFEQRRSGGPEDANMCQEAASRIEALETALKKIADDEVTHTKLNQQRLCCKFQSIALEALNNE